MASLYKRPGGAWSVQFEDVAGRRRTLSLGQMAKRDAEAVRLRVEKLSGALIAGGSPDLDTARWVESIGEKLRAKLEAVGLVQTRTVTELGPFVDAFLQRRRADPQCRPQTRAAYVAPLESLRLYFGTERPLGAITRADAREWRSYIAAGRAENTIRKWVAKAKRLFNEAIEAELIGRNPFAGLAATTIENRERDYFVSVAEAAKVLGACPSTDWRLIFALARFGGLRCPSEVLMLRWADVLWSEGRMIVRSPKTERHEGRGSRVTPIFPELMPFLMAAFDEAPDGAVWAVEKTRDTATNLRTQLTRIIERAGLKPWPKLFQNLRATRATELADKYPGHVAAAWLGHSVKIARGHYWQVTEDHFEAAQSAANALHTLQETSGKAFPQKANKAIFPDVYASLPTTRESKVAREGLEPPTKGL